MQPEQNAAQARIAGIQHYGQFSHFAQNYQTNYVADPQQKENTEMLAKTDAVSLFVGGLGPSTPPPFLVQPGRSYGAPVPSLPGRRSNPRHDDMGGWGDRDAERDIFDSVFTD